MSSYSVQFPGIQIFKADMVHVHGVHPSVCVCDAVLSNSYPKSGGDLRFLEDDAPILTFKDCAIRNAYTKAKTAVGPLRSRIEIVDRRWKWKGKTVGGRFNVKSTAGTLLTGNATTWKQLFEIVFEALGESEESYSLDIPNNDIDVPAIEWESEPATEAMEYLLKEAGCILSLLPDNTFIVESYGNGPEYPWTEGQLVPVVNFNRQDQPSKIIVEFAPTIYQTYLECDAIVFSNPVGEYGQGGVRGQWYWMEEYPLLDNYNDFLTTRAPGVQFIPQPSTGYESGGLQQTGVDIRGLDFRIFKPRKLYRELKFGENSLPDGNKFSDMNNLLPLRKHTFSFTTTHRAFWLGFAEDEDREAGNVEYVDGDYVYNAYDKREPVVYARNVMPFAASLAYTNLTTYPLAPVFGFCPVSPSEYKIDLDSGIVTFDDFQIQMDNSTENYGNLRPSEVLIYCSFHAREDESTGLHRHSYEYELGGSGAELKIHDDRAAWYVETSTHGRKVLTNRGDLDKSAATKAEAYAKTSGYNLPTSWVEWAGIRPYAVRGNVHQMRWHISQDKTYTQGGKNLEHPVLSTGKIRSGVGNA